jgi:simple sugar transport system substrate-binding protein
MKNNSSRRSLRVLAVIVAASAVLAGCSSHGGAQNQNASAPAGGGGGGTGEKFTIAMITHEAAGDTFWDKVRAGAEQAAKNTGVELRYANNPDGGQQATLVQNAIDSKVDGIAVTLSQADAVGPAAQKAVQAGIPTVGINAGITEYQKYGIPMYFGSDEDIAGQAVGQRLTHEGGGKAICVITEQGSVALEARCAGVKKTFPNTENLYVNGTDLPSVQQTLGAKLQQDPSINTIVSLGAPFALAAMQATAETGSQAKNVSFDLNADLVKAVKDKKIEFTVDQQPYVQGYMAVEALWLNIVNGNDLGGGKPVLTGPSFVDSTNIDKIAEFATHNTR